MSEPQPGQIIDHAWAAVGALRFSDFSVAPGMRVPPHEHANAHLCVVMDGAFEERQVRGTRWCEPSTIRYSPAGDRHSLTIGRTGLRCLVIEGHDDADSRDSSRSYVYDASLLILTQQLQRELSDGAGASPLTLESLALELFAQTQRRVQRRRGGSPPSWVYDLRDLLHARYADMPQLSELGAQFGRHPMQVARAFREHFGCTIGECARRLQVDHARRLILQGDAPLSRIALEAGFADQSHMTRLMRRLLHTTPARLRGQARHTDLLTGAA